MVRAKFKVQKVTTECGYNTAQPAVQRVTLLPVTDAANIPATDTANNPWATDAPSGSIEMEIENPAALDQFKPGAFFFVDFMPAPATEAEETK